VTATQVLNWNGRVAAHPAQIERPRTEEALAAIVRRARAQGQRVKAMGARHSFNAVWATRDVLVDLSALRGHLRVDADAGVAHVPGGMRLLDLVRALENFGLALANVGAWLEQTIAGVVSTATHGSSGRWRKTLIGSVRRIRLVDGTGQIRDLVGEDLRFVTLGLFGVITEVELQCEPLFFLRERKTVVPRQRLDEVLARLSEHDFVDVRWAGRVSGAIVTTWDRTDAPPTWRDRLDFRAEGARLWVINRTLAAYPTKHVPPRISQRIYDALGRAYVEGTSATPRTSVWHEALTFNSYRFAAPHDEYELAIPMDRAEACLRHASEIMRAEPSAAAIEVQVRFSPGVDARLAPHHGRETMWLNLNVFDDRSTRACVDAVVAMAYAHGGRAHWCKRIHDSDETPTDRFADYDAWQAARAAHDPDGVFLNDWARRYLTPQPGSGTCARPRAHSRRKAARRAGRSGNSRRRWPSRRGCPSSPRATRTPA